MRIVLSLLSATCYAVIVFGLEELAIPIGLCIVDARTNLHTTGAFRHLEWNWCVATGMRLQTFFRQHAKVTKE